MKTWTPSSVSGGHLSLWGSFRFSFHVLSLQITLQRTSGLSQGSEVIQDKGTWDTLRWGAAAEVRTPLTLSLYGDFTLSGHPFQCCFNNWAHLGNQYFLEATPIHSFPVGVCNFIMCLYRYTDRTRSVVIPKQTHLWSKNNSRRQSKDSWFSWKKNCGSKCTLTFGCDRNVPRLDLCPSSKARRKQHSC